MQSKKMINYKKMKTKFKKILLSCTLIGALALGSCMDFLKEDPKTQRVIENFWQTEADAVLGVNALYTNGFFNLFTDAGGGWEPLVSMYNGIISGFFTDRRSDRSFSTDVQQGIFNLPSVTPEAQRKWNSLYIGINRANLVINHIPGMTDVLSDVQVANFTAQGRFFRAVNYFELVKNFGDVPFFETPFLGVGELMTPRTPSIEIYQAIERDLLAAIPALPNVMFYGNSGRITRPIAQTLLAMVYLQWAGYPMNGGSEMYTKAAAMAQQVINGGTGHGLIHPNGTTPDLNSAFNLIRTAKAGTPGALEIIWAREFNQSAGTSQTQHRRGVDVADAPGVITDAAIYYGYLPAPMLVNSFHPDDVRGMNQQFFFRSFTTRIGEADRTFNLAAIGNWFWWDEDALRRAVGSSHNIPLSRFSDVLLIAAEGLARTGNDVAARGYLNQVRRRAGVADNTTDAGQTLIQAILTERFHEFPLEYRIFDDIRRTRLYPQPDGMHSGTLRWVPLAQAEIQNRPREGEATVGYLPVWALLWPIPQREMQANTAFVGHQNPGWD
jgi:hypothetical protein